MSKVGRFSIPKDVEKYKEGVITPLEEYISKLTERDMDAHVHLFKMYSFYPKRGNVKLIKTLLLRCLKYLPHPDFSTSMYLLIDEILEHPDIKKVRKFAGMLDTSDYGDFWRMRPEMDFPDEDFDIIIRDYIMTVTCDTMKRMKIADLCKIVNLDISIVTGKEFLEKYELVLKENDEGFVSFTRKVKTRRSYAYKDIEVKDLSSIIKSTF